jgi:hypothetical protein
MTRFYALILWYYIFSTFFSIYVCVLHTYGIANLCFYILNLHLPVIKLKVSVGQTLTVDPEVRRPIRLHSIKI